MSKKKQLTLKDIKSINRYFPRWSETFVKIIDNNGEQVPFILNKQQLELYKGMDKLNICLKSRQLGITSFACCYALWLCCTRSDTNTAVLADNIDNTHIIFDEKLKKLYYSIPDSYKKLLNFEIVRDNKQELLFSNGSRVSVKVASTKELFRGSTMQFIHCSEFAFWGQIAQTKGLLGLQQSLAKNKDSRILIESTPSGLNEFYNIWKLSEKPDSAWKGFFFPWFYDRELFKYEYELAEEWWRSQPINKGQRFSYDVDCDEYERKLYDEEKVQLRQLCWRRWKFSQGMTKEQFFQEYPSFSYESFVTSGQNVFKQSMILDRMNYLPIPLLEEELTELPDILQRYINKGLKIFALPRKGIRYYAGVDSASGNKGDFSTMVIIDQDARQVATFARDDIPIYIYAEIVDTLGRFFNTAYLVVETNNVGTPLLERIKEEYLYPNLYRQRTFNKGRRRRTYGFTTTSVTKSILIEDFKELFQTSLLEINDKELLEEMQIYQVNSDGSMSNKRGDDNHDDLIIATALAIQGLKTNKYLVNY